MTSSTSVRTKVFISYSHKDAKHLERLQLQLSPELHDKSMELWDDTKIKAGAKWREEIARAIDCTKVAVLLVSADFLGSEFIHNNELPPLLSAAEKEGVTILPVLLKPCRYESTALMEFQFVNKPRDCIISLREPRREQMWKDVANAVIDALKAPLVPSPPQHGDVTTQQRQLYSSARRAADEETDETKDHKRFLKESQAKIERGKYDVFLCHNTEDKSAVIKIGKRLKEKGYAPWLDTWDVPPHRHRLWVIEIQKQITNIKSAAVFIGKSGEAPWQNREIEALLHQFIQQESPVIPVLLEDALQKPELPSFLEETNWVDFSKKPISMKPFPVPTSLPPPPKSADKVDKPIVGLEGEILGYETETVRDIDPAKYAEMDEIRAALQEQQMVYETTYSEDDEQDFYLGLEPIELLICAIEGMSPSRYQSHRGSNR